MFFGWYLIMAGFLAARLADLARAQALVATSYEKKALPRWGKDGLDARVLVTTVLAVFLLNLATLPLTKRGRVFVVHMMETAFTVVLVSVVLGIVLGMPLLAVGLAIYAARLGLLRLYPLVLAAISK